MKRLLRHLLAASFYREGAVRRILAGPGRGLRYRVFSGYGLSPILGGWERDAQSLMVRHIGPDAVVYDVGANYGIHTLLMSRLASSGHIYAFEPAFSIQPALKENLDLNEIRNVSVVPLALSDRAGKASFITGHHHGASHLAAQAAEAEETDACVDTTTLDEFAFSPGKKLPSFIKIDVEGGEGKVLSGGSRVLREARPVLLIDLHNPEQDRIVGQILIANDYHAFRTESGEEIERLDEGWPSETGLWGQILALPSTGIPT